MMQTRPFPPKPYVVYGILQEGDAEDAERMQKKGYATLTKLDVSYGVEENHNMFAELRPVSETAGYRKRT